MMPRPFPILALCLLSAVFISPRADADSCPAVPQAPVPTSDDRAFQSSWQYVAEPYTARHAAGGDAEPAYGVGHLHTRNSDAYYDWPRQIVLPLWHGPTEGAFLGWIHTGRVYTEKNALPRALTGIGMVETDYEYVSFIVYERRDGGWLRIKLTPGGGGDAWTHECHLGIAETELVYEGWKAFLRRHGQWLHFRVQVPHMLRERPSINSPVVTRIGLDHKLILLNFNGDWMRVKVEQPDHTCAGADRSELRRSVHEGWVKWRDDKMGPWIFVHTRGC